MQAPLSVRMQLLGPNGQAAECGACAGKAALVLSPHSVCLFAEVRGYVRVQGHAIGRVQLQRSPLVTLGQPQEGIGALCSAVWMRLAKLVHTPVLSPRCSKVRGAQALTGPLMPTASDRNVTLCWGSLRTCVMTSAHFRHDQCVMQESNCWDIDI